MRRRRASVIVVVAACGVIGAGGAAYAATTPSSAPQLVSDPKGDVSADGLDLTRFALQRSADGRLRASITLADGWDGDDLLADSGPPGSLCVKLWTTTVPPDTTPDWLVCVTADKDGGLRGSVLQQRANKLPARTGGAEVTRSSERSVTIKFSQTAIGKPATVSAVAEATRPGCTRGSCVDLAPDAPKAVALKLRDSGGTSGGTGTTNGGAGDGA